MSRLTLSWSLPALLLVFLVGACGTPSGRASSDASSRPDATVTAGETMAGESTARPGGVAPKAQPPIDGPLPDRRSGAVTFAIPGRCPEPYSAAAVAERDFAFDGTVTAIEGAGTASASASVVTVTFEVHEWLVGGPVSGGAATVEVRMPAPNRPQHSEAAPSYFVGTRLLVSGDDRAREPAGKLTAWACGFTRYHDEDTAATWRS